MYQDSGLTIGEKYTYKVVATKIINDEFQYGKFDYAGVSGTALMDAPKMLAVEQCEEGVKISWEAVDGADGYEVRKRLPAKSWITVDKVDGVNSLVDNQVIEGLCYEYTVRAYTYDEIMDQYTYGSYDKEYLLWLQEPETPNIDYEVENDSVAISWDRIEGIGGYSIQRQITGTDDWEELRDNISADATEYVDKSIEKGNIYKYKVIAYIKNNDKRYEYESNLITVNV